MASKQKHDDGEEPGAVYVNKAFRLTAAAVQAFDVLKGRQGPRSGVRLAAEAIDLLLLHYGERPVGPMRQGTAKKTPKP